MLSRTHLFWRNFILFSFFKTKWKWIELEKTSVLTPCFNDTNELRICSFSIFFIDYYPKPIWVLFFDPQSNTVHVPVYILVHMWPKHIFLFDQGSQFWPRCACLFEALVIEARNHPELFHFVDSSDKSSKLYY